MAQTPEGALKASARKRGMTVEEYRIRTETEKWCFSCSAWRPRIQFNKDLSRGDGLCARCQDCTRVKSPKSHKGRVSTFLGHKHTEEAKRKMSEARKGRPGPFKGEKRPEAVRAKLREYWRENAPRGSAHYAYTHGKHQRALDARRTVQYADWRLTVFTRDHFTCKVASAFAAPRYAAP